MYSYNFERGRHVFDIEDCGTFFQCKGRRYQGYNRDAMPFEGSWEQYHISTYEFSIDKTKVQKLSTQNIYNFTSIETDQIPPSNLTKYMDKNVDMSNLGYTVHDVSKTCLEDINVFIIIYCCAELMGELH